VWYSDDMALSSAEKKRLAEVKNIAKARAHSDRKKLLAMLADASGEGEFALELRREIYSALSWHEDAETRALLLDAIANEPDDVAETIAYVLWRQEDLMKELPQRIDAVRETDPKLAGRLLTALVRGDDRHEHRGWVFKHHLDLLRKLRIAYD